MVLYQNAQPEYPLMILSRIQFLKLLLAVKRVMVILYHTWRHRHLFWSSAFSARLFRLFDARLMSNACRTRSVFSVSRGSTCDTCRMPDERILATHDRCLFVVRPMSNAWRTNISYRRSPLVRRSTHDECKANKFVFRVNEKRRARRTTFGALWMRDMFI